MPHSPSHTYSHSSAATTSYLGWLSIGIGALEIIAPSTTARAVGLPATSRTLMRALGLREIATGVALIRNPSSKNWAWARVAGDIMDLSILGKAALVPGAPRGRLALSGLAVAGVGALDASSALTKRKSTQASDTVRETVAIDRSPSELYSFWREVENLPQALSHIESIVRIDETRSRWRTVPLGGVSLEWESEIISAERDHGLTWRSQEGSDVDTTGTVRFTPLTGDRGTAVAVEMSFAVNMLGESSTTTVTNPITKRLLRRDLKRLKQKLETGEVATTDGQSAGRRTGSTWLDELARA